MSLNTMCTVNRGTVNDDSLCPAIYCARIILYLAKLVSENQDDISHMVNSL